MKKLICYRNYIGEVTFSSEDSIFIGRITGIHDTVIFEGSSEPELFSSFGHAVDNYIAFCRMAGKEPEKSFSEDHLPAGVI